MDAETSTMLPAWFSRDSAWIITVRDEARGLRARLSLPPDGTAGFVITDVDEAGDPRPDAKVRILSPDEVVRLRGLHERLMIAMARHGNG